MLNRHILFFLFQPKMLSNIPNAYPPPEFLTKRYTILAIHLLYESTSIPPFSINTVITQVLTQ